MARTQDCGNRSERQAAVDLADRVAAGSGLPELASRVLLDVGEVLHAEVPAQGWRYHAADVAYETPRPVAIGGPLVYGFVAAGSAIARRRAHQEAVALAVPQWRPLGALQVLATNRRLLVWHQSAWASVWYESIRELRPAVEADRLDLMFDDDPPYSLAGPWIPYLAVVVTTVLAQQRGVAAIADALRLPVSD